MPISVLAARNLARVPAWLAAAIGTTAACGEFAAALRLPLASGLSLACFSGIMVPLAYSATPKVAHLARGYLRWIAPGGAAGICFTLTATLASRAPRDPSDQGSYLLAILLVLLSSTLLGSIILLPSTMVERVGTTPRQRVLDQAAIVSGSWLLSLAATDWVVGSVLHTLLSLGGVGAALILTVALRAFLRTLWLKRVRRGLVPGFELAERDWDDGGSGDGGDAEEVLRSRAHGARGIPYRTSARPIAFGFVGSGSRDARSRVAGLAIAAAVAGIAGGMLASSCASMLVQLREQDEYDARYQTCRTLYDVERRLIDLEASKSNPEAAVPLKRTIAPGNDGWGHPWKIECDSGQCVPRSAGRDGVWDTDDDLRPPCY